MIDAVLRSIGQLPDPAFFGAVLRSVVWSLIGFFVLTIVVAFGLHAGIEAWLAAYLSRADDVGWLAALFGVLGTLTMSVWLFVPVSTAIASMFTDRIANAVEQRFYPHLPYAAPAPLISQLADAAGLGLRVLILQALAGLTLLIPPHATGVFLSWLVSSWAVGRGLFVPVAMRRMDRTMAVIAYRQRRTEVVLLGGLIVAAGFVPILNLFAPILGVAAMVHALHGTGNPRVVAASRVV